MTGAHQPDEPDPGARAHVVITRRALFGLGGTVAAITACTSGSAPRRASSGTATEPTTPAGQTSRFPPPRSRPATSAARTSAAGSVPGSANGPAPEVGRGLGVRPEVALTFHGAGDITLARQILRIAAGARAQISVFVVGIWLSAQPQMAHEITAGGHELGNHTWSHPTLLRLGRAATRAEIDRCRDLLTRLTGGPGRYFRQSGSQHSTALIRALAGSAGYQKCVSYDIDSMDWTDPGAAAIRTNVAAATAGSIVSLHLGHAGTVAALPGILADLHTRGLRAVTVSELLR